MSFFSVKVWTGFPEPWLLVSYISWRYHQNTTSCQLNISNAHTAVGIVSSKFANAECNPFQYAKYLACNSCQRNYGLFKFFMSRPVFLIVVDKFAIASWENQKCHSFYFDFSKFWFECKYGVEPVMPLFQQNCSKHFWSCKEKWCINQLIVIFFI